MINNNDKKKIIIRFQKGKIIKKKDKKNIFELLVNKLKLKNELKNKFILWKKYTKINLENDINENINENAF